MTTDNKFSSIPSSKLPVIPKYTSGQRKSNSIFASNPTGASGRISMPLIHFAGGDNGPNNSNGGPSADNIISNSNNGTDSLSKTQPPDPQITNQISTIPDHLQPIRGISTPVSKPVEAFNQTPVEQIKEMGQQTGSGNVSVINGLQHSGITLPSLLNMLADGTEDHCFGINFFRFRIP